MKKIMKRKDKELRLKFVTSQVENIDDRASNLQRDLSGLQRESSVWKKEQREIVESLVTVNKNIGVSDHAVLRYLERKFNLDMVAIRKEILTPERESAIRAGATKIKTELVDFVVKDNTIVTSI